MSALPAFSLRLHDPEVAPRSVRLKQICQMYCREHPQISGGAKQQYFVAVNLCRRWLLGLRRRTCCNEVFTLERFLDFAAWLAAPLDGTPDGKCRSAPTINGRLDTLWMLWEFAEEENLCGPRPPVKKKPRWQEDRPDPVAFTVDQIVQLIAACMRAPKMRLCEWWSTDFWVTLIGCYLSTAERFEALLRTPRSALTGNVLTVPASLTKDGKENPVVLPEWIADKIRRLPEIDGSPLIWPYPFRLKQLRDRYTQDILLPAKLPCSRYHKFHALRRSALTQVSISHGLEAAREMARHFGQGLTLERYISRSVVKQQTGTPNYRVPAPTTQKKLFQ